MSRVRTLLSRTVRGTVGSLYNIRSTANTAFGISRSIVYYAPIASADNLGTWSWTNMEKTDEKQPFSFLLQSRHFTTESSLTSSNRSSKRVILKDMLHSQHTVIPLGFSLALPKRGYSWHAGDKQSGPQNGAEVPLVLSVDSRTDESTDAMSNEWTNVLNHLYQSATDAVVIAGQKAKEASDTVVPFIKKMYDSHPYTEQVIVPLGGTLFAAILSWFVLPRILKRFHKYSAQNPLSLLSGSPTKEQVPYENSMWGALEDPVKYFITFMAFCQMGVMIVPTSSDHLSQVWRGAIVLSFLWFLYRLKTNFFGRAMENQISVGLDKEKLLILDKLSSVGLIILGVMALAEACGVAVQSILTIGGIGGVATAFAAKDIIGNMLSGISLQFLKPFTVGENIKAGSVEGQVVDIGLTTTSLMSPEKFPVIVPNSMFSSQVIINKSRAEWSTFETKIPLDTNDVDVVPCITEEIATMMRLHPKVYLEKDAPYCFLSRIESSSSELTIGCNLNKMKKNEVRAAQQDIILKAVEIIRGHGAQLGGKDP